MNWGNDEDASILNIALEKETDQTLSAIAEGGINWEAEQEEEESEDKK